MDEGSTQNRGARPIEIALVAIASLALFWALVVWFSGPSTPAEEAAPVIAAQPAAFTPPDPASIPEGPDGEAIERGRLLFTQTQTYAAEFAGSGHNCSNCHLEEGRLAGASPMWAAWGMYPAWRAKTQAISTMEDRIMGCFVYSMNAGASPAGVPPPAGHDIYRDLQSYFAWLATGAPSGTEMAGRGYPQVPEPAEGFDRERGAQVYTEQCEVCHGPDGAGVQNPDGTYAFPPLWGDDAFNWGAGMSRMRNAVGFIKANMPFGMGGTLTDQQAWDVAAYVVTHERPPDPRQQGRTIEQTRVEHHQGDDFYGEVVDGDLLGDGVG